MGADAFYVYFGVKRLVSKDDEPQIRMLEEGKHPLLSIAKAHTLQAAWGRLTDGEDYFLLIGEEIGRFGIEGVLQRELPRSDLQDIIKKTDSRLKAAAILEMPRLIMQLHAQF